MSRIDDALKRAAVLPLEHRRRPSEVSAARPTDESVLEEYPREDRRTMGRQESVAPLSRTERTPARLIEPGRVADANEVEGRRESYSPVLASHLVTGADAPPVSVEQYRRLAASLHELQLQRKLKALLVTSAVPREGKSFTAANLALTLSESYRRRVLIIDADLRRPGIHEYFGVANQIGLNDVLRSDRQTLPLTRVTPMLTVLAAGVPDGNAVGGITSDRMRTLLDDATAEFDWVLLDAPPVSIMPDAALLASMVRAVLLVIGSGTTQYSQVERAIDEIGREYIVGTVLNRIDDRNIPDSSSYREYYQRMAVESEEPGSNA